MMSCEKELSVPKVQTVTSIRTCVAVTDAEPEVACACTTPAAARDTSSNLEGPVTINIAHQPALLGCSFSRNAIAITCPRDDGTGRGVLQAQSLANKDPRADAGGLLDVA